MGTPKERSATPDYTGVPAKEYTLDIPRIPSIELPLKVSAAQQSVQRAIGMCGGIDNVKKALNSHKDTSDGLELYLNDEKEEDGSSKFFNEHPITGRLVPERDESIVMKLSLPKGTLEACGGDIQKAILSVPPNRTKIVPVGIINNTIRFREMSDFQVRLDNVPSAREFNDSFGTLDWANFKSYVQSIPDQDSRPFENINRMIVDRTTSIPSTDFQLPPPPRFSMVNIPFVYKYKGNPYATKSSTGESTVKGTYLKNYQQLVHDFGKETKVPVTADPSLQKDYEKAKETGVYPGSNKDSKFFEKLEECLQILSRLFEKRRIWVKRHIDGLVPQELHPTLKIALSLVSYRFTKGPWRNTYIKFGIDPRDSPEYAKFQTEYFKIESRLQKSPLAAKYMPDPPPKFFESDIPEGIDSRFHFNGKQIPWYLMLQIDLLTDEPNIAEVFSKAEYLEEPTELTGWFHELDLTKIRRIVKYELGCLVQGNSEFSEYKLKFFKNMLYSKESMMSKSIEKQAPDADGDIEMANTDNHSNQTTGRVRNVESEGNDSDNDGDDDDNGVEAGELDDTILEQEEGGDDDGLEPDDDSDGGATENRGSDVSLSGSSTFDIKSASFDQIIRQVSQRDPELASRLRKDLDGFVFEQELS
ncbi:LAQU0S04e05798g1_1 [Lachancea quebecensis]|uniref:LAQU0S04e05798g1_1 n=1 Tax=Lachancea quebecensis TaxID=1654605 RepID=A0A0P1KPN6_9SACH|nr:LAQU0S04e05798g1_1 [Lachancea quebecensis]